MLGRLQPREKPRYTFLQEAQWTPKPVWTWGEEKSPHQRHPGSNPGRPARSQAPCRLSYLANLYLDFRFFFLGFHILWGLLSILSGTIHKLFFLLPTSSLSWFLRLLVSLSIYRTCGTRVITRTDFETSIYNLQQPTYPFILQKY